MANRQRNSVMLRLRVGTTTQQAFAAVSPRIYFGRLGESHGVVEASSNVYNVILIFTRLAVTMLFVH